MWSDQATGFLDICQNSSGEVWKYFLKNRHTEKARCKTCRTTLSCKGGTTTTLKNHLKTHGITISTKRLDSEAEENDETEVFPSTSKHSKTTPIRIFFFAPRKDILGEIIASLVAEDGLNFYQIAESERIRKLCKNHEKTL